MSVGRPLLVLAFLLLYAAGGPAVSLAQDAGPNPAAASAFVERVGNKAISIMSTRTLSKRDMITTFRALLQETFDMGTVGRFVLGRHWNLATPQQQQDYVALFEEMLVLSYADRFTAYEGEKFRITGTKPEGDRDAFVTTEIFHGDGPPVKVDWRVRSRGADRLAVVDVVVEGVSMSLTQRQEFASVIQAKGGKIEGLLGALREKNAALSAAYK